MLCVCVRVCVCRPICFSYHPTNKALYVFPQKGFCWWATVVKPFDVKACKVTKVFTHSAHSCFLVRCIAAHVHVQDETQQHSTHANTSTQHACTSREARVFLLEKPRAQVAALRSPLARAHALQQWPSAEVGMLADVLCVMWCVAVVHAGRGAHH